MDIFALMPVIAHGIMVVVHIDVCRLLDECFACAMMAMFWEMIGKRVKVV